MTQEYQLAQEKLLVFYHELENKTIFCRPVMTWPNSMVSQLLLLLIGPKIQFCLF